MSALPPKRGPGWLPAAVYSEPPADSRQPGEDRGVIFGGISKIGDVIQEAIKLNRIRTATRLLLDLKSDGVLMTYEAIRSAWETYGPMTQADLIEFKTEILEILAVGKRA